MPSPRRAHDVKRSVLLKGKKTSVSLEEPFWSVMKDITGHRGVPMGVVIGEIDKSRKNTNLSSAIRTHVLKYVMSKTKDTRGL
jgi:predicted DNA-binding ribbon-helix-helix protein